MKSLHHHLQNEPHSILPAPCHNYVHPIFTLAVPLQTQPKTQGTPPASNCAVVDECVVRHDILHRLSQSSPHALLQEWKIFRAEGLLARTLLGSALSSSIEVSIAANAMLSWRGVRANSSAPSQPWASCSRFQPQRLIRKLKKSSRSQKNGPRSR